MLDHKRTFKYMVFFLIYIFLTTQLHYAPIPDLQLSHIRHLVKGLLDMLPLIFWFWFIMTMVIQPTVRKCLVMGSLAMQFSMFVIYLQTIVVTDNITLMAASVICIYCSYFIYPVFSLLATLCLGMPEQYKPPRKYLVLPIIAGVFLLLGLTNSLHSLFFKFSITPENINRAVVEPGIVCYLSILFTITVYVWRLVALGRFSKKKGQKTTFTLILSLLFMLLIYHVPYIIKGFFMEWEFIGSTQLMFYVEVFSWIICMTTGLVPVNSGYDKVYAHSSLNFTIYNKWGKAVFPKDAKGIDENSFRKLVQYGSLHMDNDTILHLSPLRKKGYVVWNQDISYINQLTLKQESLKKQLTEQEEELQNELTLANEKEKIKQKSEIYNKIDSLLKVDVNFLKSCISSLASSETVDYNLCREILRRGIYIKRKGNLLILADEHEFVPISELKLTMDEMITGLSDIECRFINLLSTSLLVKTSDIISCLELLQRTVLENSIGSLQIRVFSEKDNARFGLYYQNESEEKLSSELSITTHMAEDKEVDQ